jgi:hypothetical protein
VQPRTLIALTHHACFGSDRPIAADEGFFRWIYTPVTAPPFIKSMVLSSCVILDYDAGLEVLMAKSQSRSNGGVNMQDLARVGAQARLEALRTEQDALLAAFPDLRGSSSGQARPVRTRASEGGSAGQRSGARRGSMTAAQRKAVGERMRAYWAARRAEKAGAAGEQAGAQASGSGKSRSRKRSRRK